MIPLPVFTIKRSEFFIRSLICIFFIFQKSIFPILKMAAKYASSVAGSDDSLNRAFDFGSDCELDIGLSDYDRECIADWSRVGDDPSTDPAHPPSNDIIPVIPPPPTSSPPPPPPIIPLPPAEPTEFNRPLTAAESQIHNALEIAGYSINPCKRRKE